MEEAGLTLTESLSEEVAGDKDKHVKKKRKSYKKKKQFNERQPQSKSCTESLCQPMLS